MTIAIGCDHIGLDLKNNIILHLKEHGIDCTDIGVFSTERAHYPKVAFETAFAVTSGKATLGILICGTGAGMCISANKVPGIRCVNCSEPYTATLSRQHNDANMLAIGARVVGLDLALMIVDNFIAAPYEGGRHAIRVAMIAEQEKASMVPPL